MNTKPNHVSRSRKPSGTYHTDSPKHLAVVEATLAEKGAKTDLKHLTQPQTAKSRPISTAEPHHGNRPDIPATTLQAHLAPALVSLSSLTSGGSITVPVSVALQTDTSTLSTTSPISSITEHLPQPTIVASTRTTIAISPTETLAPTIVHIPPSVSSFPVFHATSYISTPSTSPSDRSSSSGPHPAIAVIILIAVGGLFLGTGLFVLLRYACCRPRKATRPVPSKPIAHNFDEEDSPIFGAKERFSSHEKDDSTTYAWTQYPVPTKPASVTPTYLGWHNPEVDEKNSAVQAQAVASDYPFLGYGANTSTNNQPSERVLPAVQAALTRSVSRLSAASASLFLQPPPGPDVGTAISISPFTGDGHPAIRRAKIRRDSAAALNVSYASAYGGAEVRSPAPPEEADRVAPLPAPVPRSASSASGRARVKAPYMSGHFKRPSISYAPAAEDPFDDVVYSLAAPQKRPDRRARDTKALTAVLGYADPDSPEMTLWPEDSMSVVGENTVDAQERRRQRQQATRSTAEASAALGSLMLMDFGPPLSTSRSLKSVGKRAEGEGEGTQKAAVGPLKVQKKATRDEGPPRVPSPPPLPSLEQMAMRSANPEEYENYRSPTYSLYACYDGKNRLTVTTNGP